MIFVVTVLSAWTAAFRVTNVTVEQSNTPGLLFLMRQRSEKKSF